MNSKQRSMRFVYRFGIAAIFAFGMMVPLVASAHTDTSNGKLKNFQHVFIIMMENTSYGSLIGNPNAPWINMAAKTYGSATNYFGVTHPSQPNYIAATSGALNGVTTDNDITINVPNIVDQIESSGRTWKAYMQSYALCTTPTESTCGNQLYERKHNPFISYQDIQSNPARVAKIVDFNQLLPTLRTTLCLTIPGSALISVMICMAALQLRPIHVTSPKNRA
jgi:phospholipase C